MTGVKRFGHRTTFAAAFAALAFLLFAPAAARAQWATPTPASNPANITNTNAGNVGVGTSTPVSKLTVSVTSNADGVTVDGTANPMFSLRSSGVVKGYLGVATTPDGYAAGASPGDLTLRSQGGKIFFNTNAGVGTSALTILEANGRVGIGTSTPANGLHVHSATLQQGIRVSGLGGAYMNFQDTSPSLNQQLYQLRSQGGLFRLSLLTDSEQPTAQQTLLMVNASGNIGIGTVEPESKLHVVGGSIIVDGSTAGGGSGNADFAIRTASRNGFWDFAAQNTNGNFIIYDAITHSTPLTIESNAPSNTMYIKSTGAVGVGTATPGAGYKLDVNGDTHVTGGISTTGAINAGGAITGTTVNATYQDVAEWVPSTQKLSAGTVVVLDKSETNHVLASTRAYDTKVAGVVSDSPGVILGVGGEGKLKVATTGRVRVKVDATRSPVEVGDLLVTSEVEGVAMKSVEVDLGGVKIHRPGTIIGKALEPLEKGTGEILVLLSLQ
jgi:hypothetical protein